MSSVEALILAGGFGSRLGGMAVGKQKCLIEVEGKPILGHILDALITAFGSVSAIVGVGYLADSVIKYVDQNKPKNASVRFVSHVPGTEGWGIYKELVKLSENGPFVAMPGDIIVLPELYSNLVTKFIQNKGVSATLAMSPDIDVVDTHGIGKISDGFVSLLRWPPPRNLGGKKDILRDMTIWSSDRFILDTINRYPYPGKALGYTFMRAVHNKEGVLGYRYNKKWVHYGYPDDFKKPLPSSIGRTDYVVAY